MGGVLTVAAGAVEGFGTVYNGLEQSAGILGKNLSQNSVKIIEHKYGPSAGALATDTFDTVGNMINLSQNIRVMTPRGLAKKTFKGTGKAIITDFKPKVPSTFDPNLVLKHFSLRKSVLLEHYRNKLRCSRVIVSRFD